MRNGRETVDAGPVKEYTKILMRAGMSVADIADRSGMTTWVIQKIARGQANRVEWITEESILGVPVPSDGYLPKAEGKTDPTGTIRRFRALAVQGFPASFLLPHVGITKPTFMDIRMGKRDAVLVSVMAKAKIVHDDLWDEDPLLLGVPQRTVKHVKACAARSSWMPTEAWADIDDPDCKPVLNTPKYLRTAEDYFEMTGKFGLNRRQAAERLGMSVDALNAALGYYNKMRAKREGESRGDAERDDHAAA